MSIKLTKFIKLGTFYLVMTIVIFFIIEGLSSSLLVLGRLIKNKPYTMLKHIKHDPLLGWSVIPNIHINNLYGDGKYFRTEELHSVELIKKIRETIFKDTPDYEGKQSQDLALKIFEELDKANKEKGSTLVAVYLPWIYDYHEVTFWRSFLSKELEKRGILFIDLTDDFRKYPDSIYNFFKNHYTTLGNKFVAEKIYEKLLSFPETAELFQVNRKVTQVADIIN